MLWREGSVLISLQCVRHTVPEMGRICCGFLEFAASGDRGISLSEAQGWRSIWRLWLHPGLSPKLGDAQQTPGRAAAASPTLPTPKSPPARSPIPPGRFIPPEILSLFLDPCGPLLQGLVTSCTKKSTLRLLQSLCPLSLGASSF